MKKHLPLIITATLTIAVLSGCTTLTRFGITEDTVVTGVQLALAKRDLAGTVSDAQLREIIAIVKAEQRLQEIGEEVAADSRVQNLIEEIINRYVIDGKVVVPAEQEEAEEAPEPGVPDEAPYADFQWRYGGERLPGARNDGSVVIALKKLSAGGIDFTWEKNLSAWGISHDHADALVCAFVQDSSGQWLGGKFDWISSSRTFRDFGHLSGAEAYKGWNLEGIPNPTQLAFVVVERTGRRRSNVITADWRR